MRKKCKRIYFKYGGQKKSKSNSVKNHEINSEKIESDYNEIRVMFLEFLNIVVLPKYLIAFYR